MCVCERETDTEREKEREGVCVCMCARERERERGRDIDKDCSNPEGPLGPALTQLCRGHGEMTSSGAASELKGVSADELNI